MTNPSIKPDYPSMLIEQRVDELNSLSEVVYQFIDVKRATMRHNRYETDGEHTLHLQMLATSYAAEHHPQLDSGKIARYAMVHDFVEVFAGDVNSLTATPEQLATKGLTEKLAFDRLQRELGAAWPSLMQLVHDYEMLEDSEARFVKLFDKCDPAFTHFENRGAALRDMGIFNEVDYDTVLQAADERLWLYAEEFPDVMAIRQNLCRRVAASAYPAV